MSRLRKVLIGMAAGGAGVVGSMWAYPIIASEYGKQVVSTIGLHAVV